MTGGKRENNSKILGAISQNNTNFLSRSQELNLKPAEKFGTNCQYILLKILKNAQELVVSDLLHFSTI